MERIFPWTFNIYISLFNAAKILMWKSNIYISFLRWQESSSVIPSLVFPFLRWQDILVANDKSLFKDSCIDRRLTFLTINYNNIWDWLGFKFWKWGIHLTTRACRLHKVASGINDMALPNWISISPVVRARRPVTTLSLPPAFSFEPLCNYLFCLPFAWRRILECEKCLLFHWLDRKNILTLPYFPFH